MTSKMRRLAALAVALALVGLFGFAAPVGADDPDYPWFSCAEGQAHLTSPGRVLSVAQGGTAVMTIDIERVGCPDEIMFSADSAPAGMVATFSESPTTADSVTLSFKTSATAGSVTPVGTYGFYIHPSTGHNPYGTYYAFDVTVTPSPQPIATTPLPTLVSGTVGSTTTRVRTSWTGIDPDGIRSFRVQRQANGGSWHTVTLSSVAATSITESLTFGSTYRYRVAATDKLGHTGANAYGPTFRVRIIQQTSSALTSPWTWTTQKTSSASGGSLKYQPYSGAEFTYSFTASSVAFVSVKGPTRANNVNFSIDDVVVRSDVSLNASKTTYRQIVFARNFGVKATHRLYVRDLGRVGHSRLDIDAFLLLDYL